MIVLNFLLKNGDTHCFGVDTCDLTPKEARFLYETCVRSRDKVTQKYNNLKLPFATKLFAIWREENIV